MMAYFADLSDYTYHAAFYRPATKNVGWLERGHDFEQMIPTDKILDLLWCHCQISVAQTRGIHECDLCLPPKTVFAARNGIRLLLGTSEIRVFSKEGRIYAASTLVYHHVHTHRYKPPDEFLRALGEGPIPASKEYFELLKNAGLEWHGTGSPPVDRPAFKFEKVEGEMRRIEVRKPIYLDES